MTVTRGSWLALAALAWMAAGSAGAAEVKGASPRTSALELKLGGYKPAISAEEGLDFDPYEATFGAGSMLLFELELDRQLFQAFGSFGVGLSLGYAEKYGPATAADGSTEVEERTGFKVLPIRALGVYRFDWVAREVGVPLVPYAKVGLVYTAWWVTKGSGVEFVDGERAAGGKWGYAGVAGLALLLDFFDPRLARDFDTGLGVNHSYLFAEYTHAEVNDFGGSGLDLSSRHWMFGLTLEY